MKTSFISNKQSGFNFEVFRNETFTININKQFESELSIYQIFWYCIVRPSLFAKGRFELMGVHSDFLSEKGEVSKIRGCYKKEGGGGDVSYFHSY